MLHEEVELYTKLSGKNGETTSISVIGAYLDGYEKGKSEQPEIIRCKDCKYWDTTWQNDYAPNYHYCPMIDGTRRNDFYCAEAERRTDG